MDRREVLPSIVNPRIRAVVDQRDVGARGATIDAGIDGPDEFEPGTALGRRCDGLLVAPQPATFHAPAFPWRKFA